MSGWGIRVIRGGKVRLDPSFGMRKVLGFLNITTASGSINVPEFANGVPDYQLFDSSGANGTNGSAAGITISGTTLSWSFTPQGSYGVNKFLLYWILLS